MGRRFGLGLGRIIRIGQFNVNGLAQNGNISMGASVVQNSSTANSKNIGICLSVGDCSQARANIRSCIQFSSINDQSDVTIGTDQDR